MKARGPGHAAKIGSASWKLAATLCLIAWMGAPRCARCDHIDEALLDQAPKILQHLKERGYRNVGVLSFMLKKGRAAPTFRGGLICDNMAERLANALLLRHPSSEPDLRVVREAYAVAAREIPGASYRTAADRQRLFTIEYPLDWGGRLIPDIFLAGKVTISPDLRTTNVAIGAFERKDPRAVYDLVEFDVPTDRHILADAGEGFSLSKSRRTFVRGFAEEEVLASIDAEIAIRQTRERTRGTRDIRRWRAGFPVTLKIFYDGVEQPLGVDPDANGRNNFTLRDPMEGQEVTFGLRNDTDRALGVVLTVNGISTLYEKVGPADQLPQWVLEPQKQYRVKGYHRADGRTYVKIVGLSEDRSRAVFDDLGGEKTAGMIHLYVFRPVDEASGSSPAFTRSIGRLSPTDLAKGSISSFDDLRAALVEHSVLHPGNVKGLATYSNEEGRETLDPMALGPVELTDTMIVQYYKRS